MKSAMIGLTLLGMLLLSPSHAFPIKSEAQSSTSPLSKACLSQDGKMFAKKDGSSCKKGDLVYINVAFDTDQAADLAEKYCDFTKNNPPEAMDVYGVLCYLRVTPSKASK